MTATLSIFCFLLLSQSEAFARSSSGFFGVHIRGGVQQSRKPTNELTCVLHAPNQNRLFAPANGFSSVKTHQRVPVEFVAETKLPTDLGEFYMRAYKVPSNTAGLEPIVIYSKNHGLQNPSVRIHDQCLTSEVFRSQRCDCKEQLVMALKYINENGGCVIYLQQEGRGIGLANKIAAYALQDIGLDTVDANLHLGFPEDMREYGVVPGILEDLGIEKIELLTNNPRKTKILQSLGIHVAGTRGMVVPTPTVHNRKYLETKYTRMEHANLKSMLNVGMTPKKETGVTADESGYCFGKQSVEDAIAAVANGEMIIVVDDMDRENEGDFIMAADAVKDTDMATIIRYSSGVICVGMSAERLEELKLPSMVQANEDPKGTAFTVSVDATAAHGITTGISAADRALTCNLLADAKSVPTDFARPGHIFPLRAKPNGVLERDGHTEAAVDFSRLAGRSDAGVLCEIVSEESPTEMMKLPELKRFAKKHGMVITSIVDLIQYRKENNC